MRDDFLTPKQTRFADFVANGMSQSESYRRAYDAKQMTDGAIRTESSRLAHTPKVADAIRGLREDPETTRYATEKLRGDWVIERLVDEAQNDRSPASSRVRALELLGKASGLFADTTHVRVKHRTPEEIELELLAKLGTLIDA